MFSRENRRRNRERLLQAAGIHQVTKDDEAFVAKLEASKNLEKRLDDARRCVYEYSLALHALSDKSASLATALAALSDDAHGDAQQALNELQTHEIKLRRTHAPAALHALQELVGAPLDGAAAGSKDVERLTKARRDKLLDCDSFAARGDERLEAATPRQVGPESGEDAVAEVEEAGGKRVVVHCPDPAEADRGVRGLEDRHALEQSAVGLDCVEGGERGFVVEEAVPGHVLREVVGLEVCGNEGHGVGKSRMQCQLCWRPGGQRHLCT